MPQNGQCMTESVRILVADAGQQLARCNIQPIRSDICLGMIADAQTARIPLVLQSAETTLALAFLVPRTGKGGEDKLPAGSLCLFPPGLNPLPELQGRGLILCISTARLISILDSDAESLPERVRQLLSRKDEEPERIQVSLTPEQVLAGNALFHCSYTGAVRNMYFKSKVLELLALFFGQVQVQEQAGCMARLSAAEQEVIARARDFLLGQMDDPPGLNQIARHVGVNETKLKRLFKEAYGLSPYAYLRVERLALAREMLVTRGVNVSEAAMSVGYSNISHFIDAFARRYGVRPGELRLRKKA